MASTDTWCTVTDVLNITGVTVTVQQLFQAGAVIDVACARPYAVDGIPGVNRIGSRDLYWLNVACAWQAAWMASQIDGFSRVDALDISQGRSRTQLRDTALFLGVHARRALQRISWLKDRSLHIQSGFEDPGGGIGVDPLSSAADGLYPWTSDE